MNDENPPYRVDEVVDLYVTAWRAALTQDGCYLWPKQVFEDVNTGVQLLNQVAIFTPILWYIEKRICQDLVKVELRNAYKAMRDESDLISQAEFLALHGTADHLRHMDQVLRACHRRHYGHQCVVDLEARKSALESVAAEILLRKELGGRVNQYNISLGSERVGSKVESERKDGRTSAGVGVITADGAFRQAAQGQ